MTSFLPRFLAALALLLVILATTTTAAAVDGHITPAYFPTTLKLFFTSIA